VRRRLSLICTTWIVGAALVRVGAVPPERCPPIDVTALRRGAEAAASWIEAAQSPDGRYVYEYDRSTGEVIAGYNVVRHAGVTMSLYQYAAAGNLQILPAADLGLDWMLDRMVRQRDFAAFAPPDEDAKLGASALMLAGLAYRRDATGDPLYDDLMRELGRFFLALQRDDGGFLAYWDPDTEAPVPELTSLYSTGEAFFGLAMLHNRFPGEGWDGPTRRAAQYVATDRDEDEGQRLGPWADQWAAYALDEMKTWPITDTDVAYARRLAARFGFYTRGEAQKRQGGPQQYIRLDYARGAGFGTVVEGVTSLWRLAAADPRLADLEAPLAERARCSAGITAARQLDASDAPRWPAADPALISGAWYDGDRTRMDDQQHSLSGLVRVEAVLTAVDAFGIAAPPPTLEHPWPRCGSSRSSSPSPTRSTRRPCSHPGSSAPTARRGCGRWGSV
jgi:hypothetical protein